MARRPTGELSERVLLREAGDVVFARGIEYVGSVHGLVVAAQRARASVQGQQVYDVALDWSSSEIRSECTCPHFAEGWFCKHLVALGLVVLDDSVGIDSADRSVDAVDRYLADLDAVSLRSLVRELTDRDPGAARLVAVRAATAGGSTDHVARELVDAVAQTLRSRGFIDYRRSFDIAGDAEQLLDELERHLDSGAADAVRPALERAVMRLRKLSESADDSGGVIGSACQRAADLYARACREGHPPAGKLARWLVKFRDESPGWPETPLTAYVAAFDDRAMGAYRKGVDELDAKYAGVDPWKRFEVDRMLLELADHDGDVDRAIELLSRGEHPRYGAIVERLRAAGRHAEVIAWIDRAVREQRVSGRLGHQGRDYWLDPPEVAHIYVGAGRADEGVEVLKREFASRPGRDTLASLVAIAAQLGRGDAEREWALAEARRQASGPYRSGAVLIDIALAEDDLSAAWSAADEFGAGQLWRELAGASSQTWPRAAGDLYRAEIERRVVTADTRGYAAIADELVTMRDLYAEAGDSADFAMYVADIKTRFARRPSLMAALARKLL